MPNCLSAPIRKCFPMADTDMHRLLTERLHGLQPEVLELRDDSHLHIGHAGNRGGGHYALLLVSEQFEGVPKLQRQRMIQAALSDLFADKRIHALSISARSPSEYFSQPDTP